VSKGSKLPKARYAKAWWAFFSIYHFKSVVSNGTLDVTFFRIVSLPIIGTSSDLFKLDLLAYFFITSSTDS
jgi:hypothetical protein